VGGLIMLVAFLAQMADLLGDSCEVAALLKLL
jgi:hypothetical protein